MTSIIKHPFNILIFSLIIITLIVINCNQAGPEIESETNKEHLNDPIFTLGQWSYNKALFSGEMTTFEFIQVAAENKFYGVELVNQFFLNEIENINFLDSLKSVSENKNIEIAILLIDQAGNLGDADPKIRREAIKQHKLWIKAAQRLGSPFVRINAYGTGSPEDIKKHCIASIRHLARYGESLNVDILIENHGGISNDASWLSSLVQSIGKDNVFLLADFDNWCIERENGELWGAPCVSSYDRYQGMNELLPFAKAISVKSFSFDEKGNENNMDYDSLFKIIKSHGFRGFLGIEYEGKKLPPLEGIKKTRHLAFQAWNNN